MLSNIFRNIPADLPGELFEVLVQGRSFRVERIVSRGHSSPAHFWYDQAQPEWVIILQGRARLSFQDREPLELGPGDYLTIPAHARHRVDWTEQDTVWLTVHYDQSGEDQESLDSRKI